jgi:uncharacterized membrane protein
MADTLTSGRPTMETARLEAFSDGVLSIVITLLAFNLTVPSIAKVDGRGLSTALLDQWPVYVAYGLSFLSILIVWINHHHLFLLIERTDHVFLILNGLLLMDVAAVPFSTQLLATYLLRPDKHVAQAIYSGLYLVMATMFVVMWLYASRNKRLLYAWTDERTISTVTRQVVGGPVIYVIALGLAVVSAEASLALCIAVAVFFALPISVSGTPTAPE